MTVSEGLEQRFRELILGAMYKANRKNTRWARPSNVGSCQRKVFYDSQGLADTEVVETEEMLLSPLIGTALHAEIERLLGDQFETETPVTLQCNGFEISGSADLHQDDWVFDLKCVGFKSWATIQNKPKAEHVKQLSLYAYAMSKPNAALIYIDALRLLGLSAKKRGRDWTFDIAPRALVIRAHPFEVDEHTISAAIGEFEAIYPAVVSGNEPPAPYDDETKFPCAWCGYKNHCYKGA